MKKLFCICCALLICAGGRLYGQGAAPAPKPAPAKAVGDLAPREARIQVNRCLTAGQYDAAIPILQQMVKWFSESKDKSIVLEMEGTYFHLGLCHFLLGHFSESNKAFEEYLKKYPRQSRSLDASVYIADGYRFTNDHAKAVKGYQRALDTFAPDFDWRTDILCSMVRCALAQDDWKTAIPLLREVVDLGADDLHTTWAATLLTIAYLKAHQYDKVYELVPRLLRPNSLASRSAGFNLAALEAGDALFAEDRYRDALWIYRLVFPKETIEAGCKRQLERLQDMAELLRQSGGGQYRELMRTQEYIAEVEEELKAISGMQDYGTELEFRLGRAYMETRRVWEARCLFLDLHELAEGDKAEEALSFAFHCAMQILPWDDAFKIGQDYMEEYPEGKFFDQISLAIGHMYAMQKEWQKVISHLTAVLKARPKHESIAECMFLIGYAYFMEEKYTDAASWLRRLNTEYPEHERREEAAYWLSMALLFSKAYEPALKEFGLFLDQFPQSPFAEDATFRHAVCRYGLSNFKVAEKELEAFVRAFPQTKLMGEAWMMLGDISGFHGELAKAVTRYREALLHDLNIELYNYCTFRSTEMLCDLKQFPGIIAQLRPYIDRNREESNIPLAIYWVGRSLWQMDKRDEAMACFRDSLEKYGVDRKALGIDLILDEWIGHVKKLDPDKAEAAWKDLAGLLAKAEQEKKAALFLRLQRGFLYKPGITEAEKAQLMDALVREGNLPLAPAVVLELIMDEGPKRGNPGLALKAAEAIVHDFAETEYGLSARMFIGKQAIERKDYAVAEENLNVIRQVFAADPVAAEALLLLGNLYLEQQKYDDADKCFESVLGVREWRGPLWPAALYGRAECARLRRQLDKAAAYYERIYVMYGRYRDWTAKGYLRRAQCLEQLREPAKARQVLQEMLAADDLRASAEGKEAQQRLANLERP